MKKRSRNKFRKSSAAFTFMELMTALIIMAILSIAVCTLTFGAMNVDKFSRSVGSSQSEIELASHRIANNLRTAQTGSIVVGTSALTTLTQPDSTDGYPSGATVAYSLSPDAAISTQNDLIETDQRFGTNVIAHNVTTFTVAVDSTASGLYDVDLVLAGSMIEERHFKVFTRN